MKIIADSSSTRTEWVLVEGNTIVEHAFTKGLNPFYHSRRDISHIIRLEVPSQFFKRRWQAVYFYGAGCSSEEKRKQIQTSLISQFKTHTYIESDLVGAARSMLNRESGIACILGTGSNSCRYDGEKIVESVRSGGFLLGDEGSGAALGRLLVSDCLKNLAPREIMDEFYAKYELNNDSVMESVYSSAVPNSVLNTYSFILTEHLDKEYVRDLVMSNFRQFFRRHLMQYGNLQRERVCFVGTVACVYDKLLREVADEFEVRISKIQSCSMPGLIDFHSAE